MIEYSSLKDLVTKIDIAREFLSNYKISLLTDKDLNPVEVDKKLKDNSIQVIAYNEFNDMLKKYGNEDNFFRDTDITDILTPNIFRDKVSGSDNMVKKFFTGLMYLASLEKIVKGSSKYYEENLKKKKLAYRQEEHEGQASYEGIIIKGPQYFIKIINEALELLKSKYKEEWESILENFTEVNHRLPSGVDVYSGRVYGSDRMLLSKEEVAGFLIHENHHIRLYKDGKRFGGKSAEGECLERENYFFMKINQPLVDINYHLQTKYWEIPFDKRDW